LLTLAEDRRRGKGSPPHPPANPAATGAGRAPGPARALLAGPDMAG
jgi:hypothetical protein